MSEVKLVKQVGVKLINTNASDDMVAMAAWVSHDADSEARLEDRGKVGGLINFLYRNRHMSPFEHGQFIFKIDVPLFVAREFHRHRTFSYNEVSGRYTQMKPRFWVGDTARVQHGKPGDYYFEDGTPEQTARYLQSKKRILQAAWDEYEARLEAGIAKEQAREDLPLSLMTQFYATVNPRNLMHFLSLRNDKHALKEIRDVAVKMEEAFAQTMPLTYAAYKAEQERLANPPKVVDGELILLKAENEALGEKLLELQSDYADLLRHVEELKSHNEELRDKVASLEKPTQRYDINMILNDAIDKEKIAKAVIDSIARHQRRRQ